MSALENIKSRIAKMTDQLLTDALMQLRKSPTETREHSTVRSLMLTEYQRRFDPIPENEDDDYEDVNTQAMMAALGL